MNKFNGIELVNGTKEGFSLDDLDNKDKMYFIRTDADGDKGYIYFNGKKYGFVDDTEPVDCGEY